MRPRTIRRLCGEALRETLIKSKCADCRADFSPDEGENAESGLRFRLYGPRAEGQNAISMSAAMFAGPAYCYAALAAPADPLSGEKKGYYGEKLVLASAARQIEGLAGRRADDGPFRQLRAGLRKNRMRVLRKGEIAVDLVGDDIDAVSPAEFSEPPQFLPRPHPADRVVGRAEDEQFYVLSPELPLEVREVDLPVKIVVHRAHLILR